MYKLLFYVLILVKYKRFVNTRKKQRVAMSTVFLRFVQRFVSNPPFLIVSWWRGRWGIFFRMHRADTGT